MLLELKQVFENSGYTKEFEFSLSNTDTENEDIKDLPNLNAPIYVKGSAYSKSTIGCLSYTVTGEAILTCDRCLKEFTRKIDLDITQTLVKNLDNDTDYDDYIVVDGTELDMTRLVIDDVLLSLPTKSVCSEDCKGLCPKCGINLNESNCECGKPDIDPRLSVLSQLLK